MNKGFTLIEALLAILILGFGMVVLLTGAARSMASIDMAADIQEAIGIFSQGEAIFPLIVTDDPMELEVPPYRDFDSEHVFERHIEETEDDMLYIARTVVTWTTRGREFREETQRYIIIREAQ